MYIGVKVVWALIAASLIILILLHSPKGDGLGGIGGQAQLFSSTKSAETSLNRLTWILTVLFLGLTLVLSANWISAKPVTTTAPTSSLVTPSQSFPAQSLVPPTLESETNPNS